MRRKYAERSVIRVALAVVERLKASGVGLPFHVEVIGFSDEEGVRYQTTYLGSRALAGTLTRRDLTLIEEKGLERAKRRRSDLLAYAEVHIEQGPALELESLALGVVSGIAGQSRVSVAFTGRAGHAGTTPMRHRRDALCAPPVHLASNAGRDGDRGRRCRAGREQRHSRRALLTSTSAISDSNAAKRARAKAGAAMRPGEKRC